MTSDATIPASWSFTKWAELPISTLAGVSLISAVLFVNEANFRKTEVFDAGADWQTLMKLGICAACGIYGIWYLNFSKLTSIGLAAAGMLLFALWSLACIVKAVNISYSLSCCATLWCMYFFALTSLQKLGPRTVVLTSLGASFGFLLGCWFSYVIAPGLNSFDPMDSAAADVGRFAGLLHPNGTAGVAATAIGMAFVALNAQYLSWKWVLPMLAFAFFTLILTGSRTWLMASLVVTVYSTSHYLTILQRAVLVSGCTVVASLLLIFVLNTWNSSAADKTIAKSTRSGSSEEIYSLTGRAYLWEFCLGKVIKSPIFGYGYGCQRFVIADEHFWPTRHAHNVLLNAALGTGLVGGALLAVALLKQLTSLFWDREDFPNVIFLLTLIGGLAENPLFNPLPGALTLLFMLSVFWRNSSREEIAARSY